MSGTTFSVAPNVAESITRLAKAKQQYVESLSVPEQPRVQELLVRERSNPPGIQHKQERVPDEVEVRGTQTVRRERYAMRRRTRQGAREVLFLDPALARSMIRKGLVDDIHGRAADEIVLDHIGRAIRPDGVPEYHVPAALSAKGAAMIQALERMRD